MKRISTLLPICLLPLVFTSCGEAKVQASNAADKVAETAGDLVNSVKDLDLSKLAPEAMAEKGGELIKGLGEKLGEVKDKASAEKISGALAPVVDKLADMKDLLADKMPSMDSLKSIVTGLKDKFSGDSGIMAALKPLLDKFTALFQ